MEGIEKTESKNEQANISFFPNNPYNLIGELKENDLEINIVVIPFENGYYTGETLNGVPHGEGVFETDWGVEKGRWRNGLRHGIIEGKDGFEGVYEWNYLDGVGQGFQKETWSNGETLEYTYKNGLAHGEYKITGADGTVKIRYYVNGELIEE